MHTGVWMKRAIAMLLAIVMTLGMAACGTPKTASQVSGLSQDAINAEKKPEAYTRQEKELIVDLMGGGENAADMTDEELTAKVEQIISAADKENLPSVDPTENKDAYDNNGAMTKPFDQVYPELIEAEQVRFSGESILIKMKSDNLTDGLKAAGIGALEQIVPLENAAWYEAKLTEGTDAKKALEAVRELKEVLLAEYNYEVQTAALDDYKHFDKDKDEEFKKNGHNKDQWHFHHCGIVDGYDKMENQGGDNSVIVAVIDTGVDYEHEDLKDNIWVNADEIPDNGRDDDNNGYIDDYYGVDIISGKGNGGDTNGHGTHVAGIIAARNNNVGVLGIAYNVKIMSVKAAMHNGTLNWADVAKAVLYAYENGAEVINMSFGGSACSIAVQDALATAYTRCVLVASAGNNGAKNEGLMAIPNYPAALTYVLGVMSVDETGRESAFTNWDVAAFNGVEYELYAPGENIMSTLPGNKYGYLSGTSMAAPMVSAFAAILRSEFSDRDKYPTKFIYGQLASTSGNCADCLNPQAHGRHNLPQIVNLNDAMTKLPKPEVNLQDYALFDDPKYSAKNNGDGVIDAGETIALGLTLRNRWGMSENTLVTIDTKSVNSGLDDPYLTIINPTVNYGSVGTYSTQDCGRIYTDELLTGWENPFLIKVSEDCPNDYRFTINVTITCENALDEADTAVYKSVGSVDENVRAGYILPSVIEEDMVLTPENLYIIPNATVIKEGITVKVMPGTHIQFWSDDANDPYADSYIAYLLVNGNFLVEGTKENPVYIYPSQLMDCYNVEIASSRTGYVSLKYADVTNFAYCHDNTDFSNRINAVERCTFRNNYGLYMYYRYVNDGVVVNSYNYGSTIGILENAKDCVFYKLGMESRQSLHGSFDRCVFTQCGLRLTQEGYYFNLGNSGRTVYSYFTNCVFLGNSFVDQTRPDYSANSAMNVSSSAYQPSVQGVYYTPETGTSYISVDGPAELNQQFLAEALEMETVSYVIFEDAKEAEKLAYALWPNGGGHSLYIDAGIYYDSAAETYVWNDGTAIDSALDPDGLMKTPFKKLNVRLYQDVDYPDGYGVYTYGAKLVTMNISSGKSLYEVPGPILPTEISFGEYVVDMDTATTYQLQPQNLPVQLPVEQFLYESSDETVLKVNASGLVTPVGQGTADVWVWSQDRAVKNRVTITVKEHIPLEKMEFPQAAIKLELGTSASVKCILTPANTTRHSVSYVSSDPSVVTVKNGVITAVGKGTATITATCEGITDTLEVSTWVRASRLAYKDYYHTRTRESCDTSLPEVIPYPANADLDLQWESDNESVLTVKNGKLVMKEAGWATLCAKDLNSGEKIEFSFTINECPPAILDDAIAVPLGTEPMALPQVIFGEGAEITPQWTILDPAVAALEGDKIVFKGAGITTLRVTDVRTGLTDEIFIYVTAGQVPRIKNIYAAGEYGDSCYLALTEDGCVYYWNGNYDAGDADPTLISKNVKQVWQDPDYGYNYALLLEDNRIAYYYRASKVGSGYEYSLPENMDPVGIAGYYYWYYGAYSGSMHVLTKTGAVYAIGSNSCGVLGVGSNGTLTELTQVTLPEPVVQIARNGDIAFYLTQSGCLYISGGSALQSATPVMIARNVTWLDDNGVYYLTNHRLGRFAEDTTAPTTYDFDYTGYTLLDMDAKHGSIEGMAIKDGQLYRIYNGEPGKSEFEHLTTAIDAAIYAYSSRSVCILTEEGLLFAAGSKNNSSGNDFLGMTTRYTVPYTRPLLLPIVQTEEHLQVVNTNLKERTLSEASLKLTFNKQLQKAMVTIYENEIPMVMAQSITDEQLALIPSLGFVEGVTYRVVVAAASTSGISNVHPAEDIVIEFTYKAPDVQQTTPEENVPEETIPEASAPETSVEPEEEPVVYETIVDETIQRRWTTERLIEVLADWNAKTRLNGRFYNNAVLNPISTDFEVSNWLRLQAPSITVGTYGEIALGGNYWGSTNERAIGLQMIDYTDFPNYARLMYAPYLTTAPENTFPFVTSVKLINKYGEEVTTVGNEEITFRITFNRDMDTTIPLLVRFGSAYPYGDYEIAGAYVDARTWEGKYTLNTLIENGYQYFTISNGCSATDDLELQLDQYRFCFEIDTTAAQALIMQGAALDTGVELKWTQDDFDTLMGYNVYRSTSEDGYYTRLNKTVIPADTMTWFDDTVEPGVVYYYNFTVVQTDLSESEPSGKIVIMSKDTMAPNIYHSPVTGAFTGSNLVLSATITDNLNIAYANLYYRIAGTDSWNIIRMNKLNDKYSAIIPAQYVTMDGIEYYIEAFDGVSYTYKGSADAAYTIAVQEAVGADALGDVDGDGVITNLDALLLLYTINDKYNMTAEEFARADLNGDGVLWAAEALRILQYVSGAVGSVKM